MEMESGGIVLEEGSGTMRVPEVFLKDGSLQEKDDIVQEDKDLQEKGETYLEYDCNREILDKDINQGDNSFQEVPGIDMEERREKEFR